MSSYFNNLLSQSTSHLKNFRRTLLSNEEDGDTEDDSHITRVLRAYYTEKGRPFPPWLPPDPNDRRAMTPQPTPYAQPSPGYFNSPPQNNYLSAQSRPSAGAGAAGARSSLNDLWDPPAQSSAAPTQPQSLRNARRPGAPSNPSSTLAPPAPQARPLPSQRAGSYQSTQSQGSGRPSLEPMPGSSSGSTAQDRLKARLYGGRPGSTGPNPPSSGNPYGR